MAQKSERQILEEFRATPAGQRLLETIRFAEGTKGDSPYNTLFGGGKFYDYTRHPDRVISSGRYRSAAAGAYQFMPYTWSRTASALRLPDFGPKSQDIAALKLARDRLMPLGGLTVVEREGISPRVSGALAPEWASFPTASGGSYYGQPIKPLASLQKVFSQGATTSLPVDQDFWSAENTGAEPTTFRLPRQSFNQQLYRNLLTSMAAQPENKNRSFEKATELNLLADELEESDDPQMMDLADKLRAQAMEVPRVAQSSAMSPEGILKTVFSTYREVQAHNKGVSKYEDYLNQLNRSQLRQRAEAPTNALQGSMGFNRNISITSASDATGEPGFDYVVEGGRRGAKFYLPEDAVILKVVGDQNWETRLEENPKGRRGYGNYIDVQMRRPDGTLFDVRFAHFDAVNPNLRPGAKLSAGSLLGTQGRTGSTTGAHISADFYRPGSNVGDLTTRDSVRGRVPTGRFF